MRTRSGHRAHGRARGETARLRTQKPRPKRACRRPGRRRVVAAPQRRQKAMRTVQGVRRKTRRLRLPRRLRRPQHGRSRGRGLARSRVRVRRVQTTLLRNRFDRAPPQPHPPRAGRLTRLILRLILRLIPRLIPRLNSSAKFSDRRSKLSSTSPTVGRPIARPCCARHVRSS